MKFTPKERERECTYEGEEREAQAYRGVVVLLVVALSSAIPGIVAWLSPRSSGWRGSAVASGLIPLTEGTKKEP